MPRLSQAILIHRYTFPIENKKEDRGYRMWKILKCHHLNVIESFWKHGVQWSCCLERCFVSSLRHSKPNESYKKHLPSQWTPDSFTLGLDSNVAPLQQEQSWERQLRNFSGLWQATLSHYISKPHIVWKRGNSFQGGQILSPTLSGQAGPGRRILMQKLPSILFPRPSEFSSSSWLFLRVWQASIGYEIGWWDIVRVQELISPQSELSSQPTFKVQVHHCPHQGALHQVSYLPHSHFPLNCWGPWSF